MENLQRVMARDEDNRIQANQAMLTLNDRLGALTETMRANQHLMLRIGETQSMLAPALQRLSDAQSDESSRVHLRNIETYLQRLLAESEQGRSRTTADLRNDLRLLTRTVAALAEPQRQ